jgi:4-hydroxy-2-oxoheptanedioate aldolase
MRKKNILRELLNKGKPSLGTHIITPWPGMFEVVGNSGVFDYVEYVSEYSAWTLPLLEDIGRTMELFPDMALMIKIEEQARGLLTTRAIDSGFQSVLFTDVRSAEDVRECIRLVRAETPEDGGIHGTSGRRHSGGYGGVRGGSATEEWVKEMNDIVVVVMIEKKGAMENLEEILSVKGVDMVQFGSSDYSISIGKPGKIKSPETQKAHLDMIKLALKKGIAPRVETTNMEDAKAFIEMGVRHFCVEQDLGIISQWCKQQERTGIKSLLASL